MKRFLGFVMGFVLCLLVPALASAAIRAKYRIDLRDGSHVFSTDRPVQRGTIVTFHPSSGGALTGLPAEEIVSIQTGATEVRASRRAADAVVRGQTTAIEILAEPLQPGDVIILGPTGDGSAQQQPGYGNGSAAMQAVPSMPPPYGAYGAYGGGHPFVPGAMSPNGQPTLAPQPGSTLSAQSGAPPTVGPNGFPVTSGNPPTIGPNGTPVLAQPGMPGSAPPAVGPNGTPVLAPPGAPGSVPPAIGPNGTPVSPPPGSHPR